MRRGLLGFVVAALVASCSGATATPIIVYVTPAPAGSLQPAANETSPPSASTPTATPADTTPEPTPQPTATASPEEVATDACSASDQTETSGLENIETLAMEVFVEDTYTTMSKAKAAAKKPSYKTLFRNAESYQNKPIYLRGQVIQALYEESWGGTDCLDVSTYLDGDVTILRVDVTRDAYGYYDDTVYVIYLGAKRVIEDDIIEFVGMGEGLATYETVLGASVTIPEIIVGKYLLIR
jgi:hypothetical protein